MSPNKTPTVFVALAVTPDQSDFFHQIEADAIAILEERENAHARHACNTRNLVILDHDNIRLALGWVSLPTGDVLTLAAGARHDHMLSTEDARLAADILHQLVHRAEDLFLIRKSVWQVALLPLNADAMDSHATGLVMLGAKGGHPNATPFLTFEPDKLLNPNLAPAPRPAKKSSEDVLNDLREAMRTPVDEEPSWRMQASALALSSAFVLVTPPVGIAMLTYAALRQGAGMDLNVRNLDIERADAKLA